MDQVWSEIWNVVEYRVLTSVLRTEIRIEGKDPLELCWRENKTQWNRKFSHMLFYTIVMGLIGSTELHK